MVLLEGTLLPIFGSDFQRRGDVESIFIGRFGDGINFATSAVRFLCPWLVFFGASGSQNKFLAFELPSNLRLHFET